MQTVSARNYDPRTIQLHWATAVLMVVLWLIGQTADLIPDGPLNTAIWSFHVLFGFALAAVLALRVAWRAGAGRRLPAADRVALHVLAKATHYGLYALLGSVVCLGVANAFVRGYNIFDLFNLPQIGDPALKHPLTHWHGLAADIVMGLAVFHAAAATVHQFVWRDGLIGRMLPGRS